MSLLRCLGEILGIVDNDDKLSYRCIHCGAEFERDYHDCPACGQPHVVSVKDGRVQD